MKRPDLGVRTPLAQSSVHSPQHSSHVIVIGGGIAGLSTAYALQEQARLAGVPLACTLIEARERLGGVILTERVGDFVIEAGPDSLLTQKPWGLDLCQTLGISDRLIGTNDRQRTDLYSLGWTSASIAAGVDAHRPYPLWAIAP